MSLHVRVLEARLARDVGEVEAAQRLRFEVFYREMSAQPTPEMAATGRDFDRYDAFCDHLLVFDHDAGSQVVGCYRLLRRAVAERNGGFYSAAEYDLSELRSRARRRARNSWNWGGAASRKRTGRVR